MDSDLCPLDRPLDFLVGRDLFWHVDTKQVGSEIPHQTSVRRSDKDEKCGCRDSTQEVTR